jgi:hypothetical protein
MAPKIAVADDNDEGEAPVGEAWPIAIEFAEIPITTDPPPATALRAPGDLEFGAHVLAGARPAQEPKAPIPVRAELRRRGRSRPHFILFGA